MSATRTLEPELAKVAGADAVVAPEAHLLTDLTLLPGSAEAVVLPDTAEAVAHTVAWCYEHDVPITPRGGGTGVAGGAVPGGGIVLGLERLARVRSFDPLLWRMSVEAGGPTARRRPRGPPQAPLLSPPPRPAPPSPPPRATPPPTPPP